MTTDENTMFDSITSTIKSGKNLLDCFRFVDKIDLSENPSACTQILNLYVLNNDKYSFDYEGLKKLLRNNIASYVYSRAVFKQYVNDDELQLGTMEAMKKYVPIGEDDTANKNYGSGGELGELLLYIFSEGFLKAKKLLSKMEIKANRKDYIKGFDGVYFLIKKNQNYTAYQIVYGEAKIKANLGDAIDDAFQSLSDCYANKEMDLSLLDGKFLNEVVTSVEEVEILKRIIIPQYRDANSMIETENAFGIFVGYSFCKPMITTDPPKIAISNKVKSDIDSVKNKIIKNIKAMKANADCDFHVFFLPFNDAKEDKSAIMFDVLGGKKNG